MFDSPPRYQNQSVCKNNHHRGAHDRQQQIWKKNWKFFSFLEYNGGMLLKVSSY